MKLMQSIHSMDVHVFLWVMQRKSQKFQVRCAKAISKTGDGYLYAAVAIVLGFSNTPLAWKLVALMALAFLIERPVYLVLKNGFKRNRPPAALNIRSFIVPSDRFSFPSGHTSAAFLVATLMTWAVPSAAPALFAWATLVGMARVILGVHFPTDTLVGAAMGASIAIVSLECLAW